MTDRYINAAEMSEVEKHWGTWVGCCADQPCHCDPPQMPDEFDATVPCDAAFLCLTWGPRVDGRWGVVDQWATEKKCRLRYAMHLDGRSVFVQGMNEAELTAEIPDTIRHHWLSLLGNPQAIAAEIRAMMKEV